MSMKIDTSEWKTVPITSLFDVKNTQSIVKKDVELNSGKIPYVTASNENNSIFSYIEARDDMIEEGNCILIGGKTMVLSYQKDDFVSNDSHNLALYLKDKSARREKIYLFLIVCLITSFGNKYQWSDSISKTRIKEDSVAIPVDKNQKPNWEYMEKYMQGIEMKVAKSLDLLSSAIAERERERERE